LKKEEQTYLERDHAWFASFAPAEDPEVVVVVLNEHSGFGGREAAPAAAAIIEKYIELKRFEKDAFGPSFPGAPPTVKETPKTTTTPPPPLVPEPPKKQSPVLTELAPTDAGSAALSVGRGPAEAQPEPAQPDSQKGTP
jgi:penicillin-binding protein 2